MKKLLCIIFALVLSLGATFALASCGEPEETTAAQTEPTPTAPATPDGYELYDNGNGEAEIGFNIRLAYIKYENGELNFHLMWCII